MNIENPKVMLLLVPNMYEKTTNSTYGGKNYFIDN